MSRMRETRRQIEERENIPLTDDGKIDFSRLDDYTRRTWQNRILETYRILEEADEANKKRKKAKK